MKPRKARLAGPRYVELVGRAVRVPDPFLAVHGEWLILTDLERRKSTWLTKAAERMGEAVTRDWRKWRKAVRSP